MRSKVTRHCGLGPILPRLLAITTVYKSNLLPSGYEARKNFVMPYAFMAEPQAHPEKGKRRPARIRDSPEAVASVGISGFSLRVAQKGNEPASAQQFVGTWTTEHEGTKFLILELHVEHGTLAGGIRVCSINLDIQGGSTAITITDRKLTEVLPIHNLGSSAQSLSFDWKDPDGDETQWKLEVTHPDAGSLRWVGLPDGLKVAPIPVRRATANSR